MDDKMPVDHEDPPTMDEWSAAGQWIGCAGTEARFQELFCVIGDYRAAGV